MTASKDLASAGNGIGARLARFAVETQLGDIPQEVLHVWRLHLVDTLACAAAGSQLPISRALRDYVLKTGNPNGGALVIGASSETSPILAALSNAFAANALDFDDGFEHQGKGMGHPGPSLIAAAMAALAERDVSVAEFLAAIAIGAEINNRLILSVQPSAERFHEVYGIGQHQSIGAAVVYGRLLGLNEAQMAQALGMSASLTVVPSLHKYNWQERPIISLKDFVAPAAQAGVQGVDLALAGFRGPQDVFSGAQGFWRMVGSDQFMPEILTDRLGVEWRALEGSIKTYPACRWIAPVLEAFEQAVTLSGAGMDDIAHVTVWSFGDVAAKMAVAAPQNAIDAQFCLPHLLACLARGLPAGLPWFTEEVLRDGAGEELSKRLELITDPQMEAAMRGVGRRPSATVELRLRDGRCVSHHVFAPLGSKQRPVSDGVVLAKAAALFGQAGLDEGLADGLMSLGPAQDIRSALAPLTMIPDRSGHKVIP